MISLLLKVILFIVIVVVGGAFICKRLKKWDEKKVMDMTKIENQDYSFIQGKEKKTVKEYLEKPFKEEEIEVKKIVNKKATAEMLRKKAFKEVKGKEKAKGKEKVKKKAKKKATKRIKKKKDV